MSAKSRSTLIPLAIFLLTGCATSTTPSPAPSVMGPLVQLACPPLAPLTDNTLGGVVLKLAEVAAQYHQCRAAAGAGR